jgi:hypothetical protein
VQPSARAQFAPNQCRCVADGNIGIGPIRSLQYCRWQQYLRMGGFTSYYALHCHVAESSRKYSASQGYARMQSLWVLRTAKATMKKLLLAGVAALSMLGASAVHADDQPINEGEPPPARVIAVSVCK